MKINTKFHIYLVFTVLILAFTAVLAQETTTTASTKLSTSRIKEKICQIQSDKTGIQGVDNVQSNKKVTEQAYKAKDFDFLKDAAEGKDYLRKYLYEDMSDEDLAKEHIKDIAPLVVLLVLSVLGYLSYVLCYFVDWCCPSCNCCKKKEKKQSKREEESKKKKSKYTKAEMRWPLYGLFVFSLWVAAAGIVGIVIGKDFTNGYYQFSCQLASFVDDFDSGVETKKWYGLEKLKQQTRKFDTDFIASVDQAFSSKPWMAEGYSDLETQGYGLWLGEGQQSSQYEYSLVLDDRTDKKSHFFNKIWGPISQDGTYTNNIVNIVTGPIKTIYDSMLKSQDTGEDIKNSDFGKVMKEGRTQIETFQADLLKIAEDLYEFINDNEDVILPSIKTGIMWYFTISILIAGLSILSAVLVGMARCYKMRVCMHVSWCVFSIWMIVGFTLSTALYSLSIMGVQSCDIIDDMREDPVFLTKLDQDFMDESMIRKMKICNNRGANWTGDGKIMAEFNIDEQLKNARSLNEELKDSLKNNQNKKEDVQKINDFISDGQTELLSLLNNGYFNTQGDTPQQIYEMNLSNSPGSKVLNDCGPDLYDFFWDGACPAQIEGTPIPSTNIEVVFSILEGEKRCANVHEYYNNNQMAYPSYPEYDSCFSPTATEEFAKTLAWVKEKNQITKTKYDELTNFNGNYTEYQQNVDNWMLGINNFMDSDMSSILQNAENMVDEGINCLFVGDNINLMMDTYCEVFIEDVYWLGIILVIHAVGMFMGSLFLVCAGFRFANVLNKQQKKGFKKTRDPKGDKYKEK